MFRVTYMNISHLSTQNFAFHMNNYCTHAAKGLVNRILARMERGEPWEDIITQFARQYLIKLQNCRKLMNESHKMNRLLDNRNGFTWILFFFFSFVSLPSTLDLLILHKIYFRYHSNNFRN